MNLNAYYSKVYKDRTKKSKLFLKKLFKKIGIKP